jgi:hypothetical protein
MNIFFYPIVKEELSLKNVVVKFCATPTIFFVMGIISMVIGFNGMENAVSFSRPANNSMGWSTSETLVNLFTYLPLSISVCFFILSVVTFTISYYFWIKIQ